jgi:hypothetical protein
MVAATGFSAELLEIHPPLDTLSAQMPCAVIADVKLQNSMPDKTKMDYMTAGYREEPDGSRTIVRIRRNAIQQYTYRLNFYYKDPESEILSDETNRSVLDRSLLFVTENQRFVTDQSAVARVIAGNAGIDTSMASDGIYLSWMDVIINDALWSTGERNYAKATGFTIRNTEVENVT